MSTAKATCIAIDDDGLFLKKMEAYVHEIEWLQLIGAFTNPVKAATEIIKLEPDFLFIDIEMPHIDGYDLIDWIMPRLMSMGKIPMIVIISGKPFKIDQENKFVALSITKDGFNNPVELEEKLRPILSFG